LLGELTYDPETSIHMGYTTAVPTVVPMKEGSETSGIWCWAAAQSGWTESGQLKLCQDWVSDMALEGRSNQPGKIAIFPLNDLTGSSPGRFEFPRIDPNNGKMHWVLDDDNSFISDLITVDFDLDKDYRGDTVYFGTVEGDWEAWAGKMYRFRTKADSNMSTPDNGKNPRCCSILGDPLPRRPRSAGTATTTGSISVQAGFSTKRTRAIPAATIRTIISGSRSPRIAMMIHPPLHGGPYPALTICAHRSDPGRGELSSKCIRLSCSDGSDCLPTSVEDTGPAD
jgi:hypothetical protein